MVKFAAPNALLERPEEIKGLLAHSHPGIQLAELIDVLASEYLERHHPEQKAKRAEVRAAKKAAESPSAPMVDADESSLPRTEAGEPLLETVIHEAPEKRLASDPQRHALTLRDGYCCAYIDPITGKCCQSRFALEPDRRIAWAVGGKAVLTNLRYLCRSHHRRVSFLQFLSSGSNYASRSTRSESPRTRT